MASLPTTTKRFTLNPSAFIAEKRDGQRHHPEDIERWIKGFQSGLVQDYQMSAWLMAVYLNDLSREETVALTRAMLYSGQTLQATSAGPPRIDKHSTGGVGDKISIALAPIAAACGLHVPMIAGRGLGHTGGTLDKLESIPGYRTTLTLGQFERAIKKAGASIIGQSKEIAPADRRMYALRDVTGTVASRPLIVASILSKKLAEGLHGLVLDVKVGNGAFMKTEKEARALARSLVDVAGSMGTKTVAQLTRMQAPLGRTIGNSLEIIESMQLLRGEGPTDTQQLTYSLVSEMLILGGLFKTRPAARKQIEKAVKSGDALDVFRKMLLCHGGDAKVIESPRRLPHTKYVLRVFSARSGCVHAIDSRRLALLALDMGAGRKTVHDKVDPAVGIEILAPVGTRITRGEPLALLHVRKKNEEQVQLAVDCFTIRSKTISPPALSIGKLIT